MTLTLKAILTHLIGFLTPGIVYVVSTDMVNGRWPSGASWITALALCITGSGLVNMKRPADHKEEA